MLEIWFNYSNKCSIYHHEYLCPAFYMERKVAVISQCSKNVLHLKWNNIASRNFNISQVKGHNNVTNNLCYLFIYLFVYLFIHSFFFIIYLFKEGGGEKISYTHLKKRNVSNYNSSLYRACIPKEIQILFVEKNKLNLWVRPRASWSCSLWFHYITWSGEMPSLKNLEGIIADFSVI